jgi:ABC-2 type transport system ATP-binding protein
MIKLEAAGKTYRTAPGPGRKARTIEAVRDITVALGAGGILGVVGPNGAGKTTLFGLLLGFLEATAGTVTINDLDPRTYVRRSGASYLPERFQLPRDWTIRSALQALLSLDRSTRSPDDILAEYDLTSYANAAAHTLSRGTMQRVGIAQAFAQARDLVVLDEPTEGLDPLWRIRFRESLRQLRAPKRIVLIASHDLVEIERVADRVLIMHEGTISDDLTMRVDDTAQRDYTIVLSGAHAELDRLFTNVRPSGASTYRVTVENVADLNARLAALIDGGGRIVSVTPAEDLEHRVTRATQPERS